MHDMMQKLSKEIKFIAATKTSSGIKVKYFLITIVMCIKFAYTVWSFKDLAKLSLASYSYVYIYVIYLLKMLEFYVTTQMVLHRLEFVHERAKYGLIKPESLRIYDDICAIVRHVSKSFGISMILTLVVYELHTAEIMSEIVKYVVRQITKDPRMPVIKKVEQIYRTVIIEKSFETIVVVVILIAVAHSCRKCNLLVRFYFTRILNVLATKGTNGCMIKSDFQLIDLLLSDIPKYWF